MTYYDRIKNQHDRSLYESHDERTERFMRIVEEDKERRLKEDDRNERRKDDCISDLAKVLKQYREEEQEV